MKLRAIPETKAFVDADGQFEIHQEDRLGNDLGSVRLPRFLAVAIAEQIIAADRGGHLEDFVDLDKGSPNA